MMDRIQSLNGYVYCYFCPYCKKNFDKETRHDDLACSVEVLQREKERLYRIDFELGYRK